MTLAIGIIPTLWIAVPLVVAAIVFAVEMGGEE